MAKIKVGELRDLKKEFCKDIEVVNFHGLEIEIKQYLPIEEKTNLIAGAYIAVADEEKIDYHLFDIGFRILLINAYTNLTLPKDTLEAFDLIVETGIYDFVYNHIPKREIEELEEFKKKYIKTEIKEIKRKNTIQYIVKQAIDNFLEKVPEKEYTEKFIETLSKEANKQSKNIKAVK